MKQKKFLMALVVLSIIVGCGGGGGKVGTTDSGGHSHQDVSLQLVGYSSGYELFAECDPFSTEGSSTIYAHLTQLDNFKPFDGEVNIRFEEQTTVGEMVRSGIYRFELTPKVVGDGAIEFIVDGESISKSITVYDNEHDAIHTAEDEAIHSSNGIVFTKEQSWRVDFATREVISQPIGQVVRASGEVLPSQGDIGAVVSKSQGSVRIVASGLVEGSKVKQGQSLITIKSSGIGEQNSGLAYQRAKNNYLKSKSDYERKLELSSQNVVSQSELLAAKTDMDNDRESFEALGGQNFSAQGERVVAPMSGYVTSIGVKNGDFVTPGQQLLTIAQNRALMIRVRVPIRYNGTLDKVADVIFRPINSERSYSLKELRGRTLSTSEVVDRGSGMVVMSFEVENRGGLIAGSFVESFIKNESDRVVLVIDNLAVVEQLGAYFVYVQLTPELFEKRSVTLGVTDGQMREIVSGLEAGERVVTRGATLVRLAQSSSTLDAHAGHVH